MLAICQKATQIFKYLIFNYLNHIALNDMYTIVHLSASCEQKNVQIKIWKGCRKNDIYFEANP